MRIFGADGIELYAGTPTRRAGRTPTSPEGRGVGL